MILQHSDVSIKTLECYTIQYQNCNTSEVRVTVYINKCFSQSGIQYLENDCRLDHFTEQGSESR